ncbi:hypothetical protein QVD17_05898 [Tagetes erecta]|uniref:Uncharacterized protein n=1 Tax=Tagetes erecta TaxID=13708 RepID=A0AAD8PAW4_TARER|nr:hypothetical protein QVD17_05898 [Tagetes erecta]
MDLCLYDAWFVLQLYMHIVHLTSCLEKVKDDSIVSVGSIMQRGYFVKLEAVSLSFCEYFPPRHHHLISTTLLPQILTNIPHLHSLSFFL